MVLIHKLKQVATIDVQQLREQDNDHISMTCQEESENQNLLIASKPTQDSQTESKTSATHPISPPRRPLTRSQTGRAPKHRLRDEDSPVRAATSLMIVSRKRAKPTFSRKLPFKLVDDPEQTEDEQAPEHPAELPVPPLTHPDLSGQHDVSDSSDCPTQLTFLNSNSSGTDSSSVIRRTPRSRVVLPVPVPNLTKKSRGRRVPTTSSPELSGDVKEGRLYVCKVEGCGKCFHRGEHLKRHIRSIHTHEKPFKCTYPLCEKLFNRHDNLLQHLKVHREPIKGIRQTSSSSLNDIEQDVHANNLAINGRAATVPASSPSHYAAPISQSHPILFRTQPTFVNVYPPRTTTALYNTPSSTPTAVISYQPYSYPTTVTASLPSETLSFSTHMAESSIRTEIPASPLLRASQKTPRG
ncbi:hypothetical protein AX17_000748 [Amanita inopinata Kibby_2008]|nr:hypothetical protein AX17_000748 [Amanita inopinata Kibby_2008]